MIEEAGALLAAITFIVFGAVLLVPALENVTWQIALYAVISLTLVRMIPVGLAMIGTGTRWPTVAFLGCSVRADSRPSCSRSCWSKRVGYRTTTSS